MKLLSMLFALIPTLAFAIPKDFTGFTKLADGRKLFVDYAAPKDSKPTVIVVNGLTNSTSNWIGYSMALKHDGYGVFLYDAYVMGQTLLNNPIPDAPIKYTQQVADLKELLVLLKMQGPYQLVGLSYGGGIVAAFAGKYPNLVKNMILMSPYTEFLESTKKLIRTEIAQTRQVFPLNPASDDELTDFFVRQFVYQNYPIYEPTTLENPYKLEGISRIVQGIRMYQPVDEASKLPTKVLHLWVAANDQYIPKDVFDRYWNAVPESARASYTFVNLCEHKIPEAASYFAAKWTEKILDGANEMFLGQHFDANPWTMLVIDAQGKQIDLLGGH